MKFYELLSKYSNEQIIENLNKNYKDIVDEAYISALDELRELKPSEEKQDVKINVEFSEDILDENDKTKYLECDGIGLDEEGNMIRWGLDFGRWEDWLAKDIDEQCLNELDELTILAGIMWELTYHGYTQNETNDWIGELENRLKEVKEHPENLVPINLDDLEKFDDEDNN